MSLLFCTQSLKTYQLYHGEWQQAEAKMHHVDNQKMKLERQTSTGSGVAAAKSALSRRFRNVEKLSEKVSLEVVASEHKTLSIFSRSWYEGWPQYPVGWPDLYLGGKNPSLPGHPLEPPLDVSVLVKHYDVDDCSLYAIIMD